jgi:hypothetical protein
MLDKFNHGSSYSLAILSGLQPYHSLVENLHHILRTRVVCYRILCQ